MAKQYQTFKDFYPFYLSQHQNSVCRCLHYVGSTIALLMAVYGIVNSTYLFILLGVLVGYAFAWVGHFFFEHNKPATFEYPWYSFIGDWKMLLDAIKGRIS